MCPDEWGSRSNVQYLSMALLKVSDQFHVLAASPVGKCSLYLLDGSIASGVTLMSGGMPSNLGQLSKLFTVRGSIVTYIDLISLADRDNTQNCQCECGDICIIYTEIYWCG
jgi:hypothetical protein